MLAFLSQIQEMVGAIAVRFLSMFPHACEICCGSVSVFASSICLLICLLLNWDQFELPWGRMFAPLNVGSRYVCGLAKSFSQPTFGQIATFADGTLQNFVYMASCATWRSFTLKPSFAKFSLATAAVSAPTPSESPTIRNVWPPEYLPLDTGTPSALALFM